jgi:nucleoside-diphosphate-sugar epimerase
MLAVQRRPAGRTLTVIDDRLAPPAAFVRYLAESASLGVPGGLPPFVGNLLSNRQQLAVMNLDVHADNRAAREALGWAPRFAGYQAAIDDMLLHWRATEPVA